MEGGEGRGSFCAVCRTQSHDHAGWFLVIENPWWNQLKILSWHPVLADQSAMHSVCGKRHLERLITHWLTYADLQFDAAKSPGFVLADHECRPGDGFDLPHPGQLVGELFVHREPGSLRWTGSAEARDGILEALGIAGEQRFTLLLGTPATVDSVQEDFRAVPNAVSQLVNEYAGSQTLFE